MHLNSLELSKRTNRNKPGAQMEMGLIIAHRNSGEVSCLKYATICLHNKKKPTRYSTAPPNTHKTNKKPCCHEQCPPMHTKSNKKPYCHGNAPNMQTQNNKKPAWPWAIHPHPRSKSPFLQHNLANGTSPRK